AAHGGQGGGHHLIGVDRNEQRRLQLVRECQRGRFPGRRQQMVGLIHHQPVWSASPCPHLQQARQQRQKELRPIGEREADQIHDGVLLGISQQLQQFVHGGSALAATDGDRQR